MHKIPFFKSFCFLLFVFSTALKADPHENSFPIEEESLARVIQEKLKKIPEEILQEKQKEWKEAAIRRLKAPKPVQGIGEASEYRKAFFDPSIIVNQDITDLNGNLIAGKGTAINSLEIRPLSCGLLLFDGTNPEHIQWAKFQVGEFKWVLVNGSPLELETQENRPIFFDQEGVICHQFDIANVPCRVLQEGKRLKIEEIPVKR